MAHERSAVICLCLFLLSDCKSDTDTNVTKRVTIYQDEWVVRVEGGPQVASLLALQSGYRNLGLVLGFKDTYLWHKDDLPHQRKRGNLRYVKALTSHTEILWADQQRIFERHKRDHVTVELPDSEKPLVREKRVLGDMEPNQEPKISQRHKRWSPWLNKEMDNPTMFNDELWNEEWYLQDTRTNKELPKLDLNVLPLYRLGINGRGIRVAVLDDGLEYTHEDLRTNYDPEISYDVNDGDDDPIPRYEATEMNGHGTRCAGEIAMKANNRKCDVRMAFEAAIGGMKLLDGVLVTSNNSTFWSSDKHFNDSLKILPLSKTHDNQTVLLNCSSTGMNGHGTRCAGEIAMEANNRKCGVGVAFEAAIGGIKLLDGVVNDRVEGEALGYKQDLVDIYTASWGPADDGKSLESPGRLATEALERGIAEGRNGRGNIYVWASGNGGSKHDDCGCDGYVGSIYTIAVGSASQTGKFPWYGERCPATLATTYSSGAYHDQMIATTDLKNKCTTRHTGTSASAPLAAGIFALALQVNKELTWRDVQHLVVYTSEYSPLSQNPGWFKNSAGFWFNARFGFGLMNAHALVIAAQNWTNVPEKNVCLVKPLPISNATLRYGNPRIVSFDVGGCDLRDEREISFLEHVQIETSIKYTVRGALQMRLTSPTGTEIQVLNPRKLDKSMEGFAKWKFMSVATWGEDPHGTWTLEISDQVGPEGNSGMIEDLTLILHGTEREPTYRKNGPRIYNDEYNRIRKMNRLEQLVDENRNDGRIFKNDNELDVRQDDQEINGIFNINWLARFFHS